MIRGRGSVGGTFIATGQFLAADGTAGVPSYSWTGEPTSGLFRNSAGNIRVSILGTSYIQFTAGVIGPPVNGLTDLGQGSFGFKRLYIDYTNTGTVGAVTINKAAGRVNVAAAGTTIVVTNSLVTAASHIFCTISTNDSTATLKNVVPAAGSFTITLTAAATAQVSIDFFVVNAD